jgi:hypothetical protein
LPLVASRARPLGSICGLRSATTAEKELKAGSHAWLELEAREEVEASREETVAAEGGIGHRRKEEVVR